MPQIMCSLRLEAFLFALFPFFFLHFMIIMVRREELLQSPLTIIFIYFAGLFSYTLELLGLIPNPIIAGTGLSPIGYVFLITWMSVIFSIGIALLFTFLKGFSDKGMKSNVIVVRVCVAAFNFTRSVHRVYFNDILSEEYGLLYFCFTALISSGFILCLSAQDYRQYVV